MKREFFELSDPVIPCTDCRYWRGKSLTDVPSCAAIEAPMLAHLMRSAGGMCGLKARLKNKSAAEIESILAETSGCHE